MIRKAGILLLTLFHFLYVQCDTIFFLKNGEIIHQLNVTQMDSILFHRPATYMFGTFVDSRDGREYPTIRIGTQTWMAVNLAYLPQINTPPIRSSTVPYYYVYGYTGNSLEDAKNTPNYEDYGVLYNYPAALTACPSGWHLPDTTDFSELIAFLGGSTTAGSKAKMTGTTFWNAPNSGATNTSGFSGRGNGMYNAQMSIFRNFKSFGSYWSHNYNLGATPFAYTLEFNTTRFVKSNFNKDYGYSIRCIKNNP